MSERERERVRKREREKIEAALDSINRAGCHERQGDSRTLDTSLVVVLF